MVKKLYFYPSFIFTRFCYVLQRCQRQWTCPGPCTGSVWTSRCRTNPTKTSWLKPSRAWSRRRKAPGPSWARRRRSPVSSRLFTAAQIFSTWTSRAAPETNVFTPSHSICTHLFSCWVSIHTKTYFTVCFFALCICSGCVFLVILILKRSARSGDYLYVFVVFLLLKTFNFMYFIYFTHRNTLKSLQFL